MLTTRRTLLALSAVLLSLVVFSSAALAASPATVTVRVEGLTETKLPLTQVTTTTEPVVKDGKPEDSCAGTTAIGALQLATDGNWDGPWEASFDQYVVETIEGESRAFGSGYYWDLWVNHAEAQVGACEAPAEAGQEILFFPCSESGTCPTPLAIEAPSSAVAGEKVSVTVERYSTTGTATPLEGATISGASESATTGPGGHASLSFTGAGRYTLHVTAPESVRTEATIEVQSPAGATSGTSSTSSSSSTAATVITAAPYVGPYALVAKASGVLDGHVYTPGKAPRLLSGTVVAHSAVSSVSLELRRSYKGRCYAYDGTSTRFVRARCGQGAPFKVSSGGSFSYLLPAALAPGRYVLDVQATDVAGNHTTLARGSSRIVFYVR
jgi:hypothetical protein